MPRHRFADTRDRLEKAAVRLFVEKGVTETSVRDIARAVDISEGALYRHFVSKDELVWAAFERHYVEFAGRLEALAKGETTARRKLAAMIRGFCRSHDENPTLFRFLLFVQHGQLNKLPPGTPTPVDAVRLVIERGIASKEIPAQDPDFATALVFGIVLQPVTFAAYGRLPSTMSSMSERLVTAAWAAVTSVQEN
ncbi:MAG TPA: TetR/AcrR family transcriptional regulator [Vicinamibacterales bacterium]|nr:TetR/AcrR family transcriptional regulator [Vicinamibacterales bacterium]